MQKQYNAEFREEILIAAISLLQMNRAGSFGEALNTHQFTNDEVSEVRRAVRAHFSEEKAT